MQLQRRQQLGEAQQFFDAALSVAVVRDPNHKLVALRWLLRDVTKRKQAEE